MIQLKLHNQSYIALKMDFIHKDAVKALGNYPDVQWHPDSKTWLVHFGLLDTVIEQFADVIEPLTWEFVNGFPVRSTLRKRGRPKKVKA